MSPPSESAAAQRPVGVAIAQWPGLSAAMQWLAFAPLICLVTIAAAELTYRCIEQPFLRRKERWRT
ncbi:MAG: hypothetical protein ACRERC_23715 [Candidatus Binatia bacterium]